MGACHCKADGDQPAVPVEVVIGNAPEPKQSPRSDAISRGSLVVERPGLIGEAYELERGQLGQGSFGSVRRARLRSTGAPRAVKVVERAEQRRTPELRQEVECHKLLDHPNVVRLYETFEDSKKLYLVMELCSGGELFHKIVQAPGELTEKRAAIVMQQLLRAVHHMHSKDVAHRDLKPENFLFQTKAPIEENALKVIDFGISCRAKESTVLTAFAGSAGYVAPQVVARWYDRKCDVWSCGVIMHLLLTGRLPFKGSDQQEVLEKVKVGKVTFDDKAWRQVSADALALARALLTVAPKERPSAEKALSHAWIRETAPRASKAPLGADVLASLRAFRAQNRLKKAALQVVCQHSDDSRIRSMRDLFIGLDADGNGMLSAGELKRGLERAGLGRRVPDLQEIIEGLDVDGSGSVDYTEFMAAALGPESHLDERLCQEAFDVFDLDGDGRITRQELGKVLDGGSFAREVVGAREQLMIECDGDGDGVIDFREFMAVMAKQPEVPRPDLKTSPRWMSERRSSNSSAATSQRSSRRPSRSSGGA